MHDNPRQWYDGQMPITLPVYRPGHVFMPHGIDILPTSLGIGFYSLLALKEHELETLKTEHAALLDSVEAKADMTDEDRAELDAMQERFAPLGSDIERLRKARTTTITSPAAATDVEGPLTPIGAWHSPIRPVSEQFLQSDEWKEYVAHAAPNGNFSVTGRIDGPKVDIAGAILPVRRGPQALIGSGATSAGALFVPDQSGIYDEGTFRRELTILDVITRGTTDSNTIEYVKVTGYTNNAAGVPEADNVDATDDTGRKPWSALTLVRVIEAVKTIAHGEAATKNALADGGQMRTILDSFLRYGLLEAVEDEIVSGTGGDGFVGILETPDIQNQAFDTDILTTTRKAKTKVRVGGRARANAYLFHPNDWEMIDLEMTLGGPGSNYRQAGIVTEPSLWGVPVVESEGVPEGTGIVADFRRAVFWDRQQTTVEATSGYMDFFMKNLVAVLAELRAGFGVIRPEAFVAIDMAAGS